MHPNASHAKISWESSIEIVSEKSTRYYEYALKLGAGHPGTALQGIGHQRHICAIVGRMLGFVDEIFEAETFDDPPLAPDSNPSDLMVHSLFLDSWVAAARRATAMTEVQRKSLWNLECVGYHGIPADAYLDDASLRGDFSIQDNIVVVYGDIDRGFFQRFKIFLYQNSGIKSVALGSAGGSVVDAILSGIEIRKRNLDTTLHGPCFSACPLVFIGGVNRTIWMGPGPHLGFHRVYTASGQVPLSDEIYERITEYLIAMGVDPAPVLQWMARASSDEIFEPNLDELCRPRVATWVQRICGF